MKPGTKHRIKVQRNPIHSTIMNLSMVFVTTIMNCFMSSQTASLQITKHCNQYTYQYITMNLSTDFPDNSCKALLITMELMKPLKLNSSINGVIRLLLPYNLCLNYRIHNFSRYVIFCGM